MIKFCFLTLFPIRREKMNKADHLNAARKRAIRLAEEGELIEAYTSMVTDLLQHSETKKHPDLEAFKIMLQTGNLNTKEKMISFLSTKFK